MVATTWWTKFRDKLKAMRYSHGLTQKEIACLLGVHVNTVEQIESGQRKAGIGFLIVFSLWSGVSVDDLLDMPSIRRH